MTHIPALALTQLPSQWVLGALSLGIKQLGHEANHSLTSRAEVKNICGSIPPLSHITSWHVAQLVEHRDHLPFIDLSHTSWCQYQTQQLLTIVQFTCHPVSSCSFPLSHVSNNTLSLASGVSSFTDVNPLTLPCLRSWICFKIIPVPPVSIFIQSHYLVSVFSLGQLQLIHIFKAVIGILPLSNCILNNLI